MEDRRGTRLWEGYTVFQREDFLAKLCRNKAFEMVKPGNALAYFYAVPVLGKAFMRIPFPHFKNIKSVIAEATQVCQARGVPLLERRTPYRDDSLDKLRVTTMGGLASYLDKTGILSST